MMENYDDLTKEKQLKLLDDMRNDSQWLVRMVENLLSVTRIDNKKIRLAKNETVLEELIDAVLVKFRKHYPQHKVQVCLPEEFISIPMDAMLIQQVLMNLLENAVFHAHRMQNLWLTVTIRGTKAVFTISDDGCGIPLDRMDSLFTGLLDSQAPTDNSRSNMGIGLSVCSAIVTAHGSEMSAKNKPEGGAEFSFALEMEEQEYGK
jgi:two-component system sensor histidine kinase KdpD